MRTLSLLLGCLWIAACATSPRDCRVPREGERPLFAIDAVPGMFGTYMTIQLYADRTLAYRAGEDLDCVQLSARQFETFLSQVRDPQFQATLASSFPYRQVTREDASYFRVTIDGRDHIAYELDRAGIDAVRSLEPLFRVSFGKGYLSPLARIGYR